jgi:hypothetical protein
MVPDKQITERKIKKETEREIKKENKREKIRCAVCNRKISMTYIECRCGGKYCGRHRYANEHACAHNYKRDRDEKIRKENPIVKKQKLEKI